MSRPRHPLLDAGARGRRDALTGRAYAPDVRPHAAAGSDADEADILDPAKGYDDGYADGRYQLSDAYGRGYADGEAERPHAPASGIRGAAGAGLDAGYDAGYRDSEAGQPPDTTYLGWTFEPVKSYIGFDEGIIHRGDLAPPPRHAAMADALLERRGDPPDDLRRAHRWMHWHVRPAERHDAGWAIEGPNGRTAGPFATVTAARAWIERRHRWAQRSNGLIVGFGLLLALAAYLAVCSALGPGT